MHWRSFTESWIDSAGPFRDVITNLVASLARQEQVRIRARMQAGLNRAKAQGVKLGRPRKVLDRQEVVRLRDEEGLSWPKIAARMDAGQGTVIRAYRSFKKATTPFQ